MGRTRFESAPCPIARTTDLLGDRWTPLVMREAFSGVRRFDAFQKKLALSRGVLAQRLNRLVDEGLLRKSQYAQRPARFEYLLTAKGHALYPVLAAMWRYGEDWLWPEGETPPIELIDRESQAAVRPLVVDEATGTAIDVRNLKVKARREPA